MKLSQSRAYIVDESGHLVPATAIMAEIERLKAELSEYTRRTIVAEARLAKVVEILKWARGWLASNPRGPNLARIDDALAAAQPKEESRG